MNAEVKVNTGVTQPMKLIALEQALIKTDDLGGPELSDEDVSNILQHLHQIGMHQLQQKKN